VTLTFAVSPEKNAELRRRMAALGVREEDLEERFVRSSGKGGQHVNKTATCVQLLHRPSGIEVKCMEGRSQSLNRFFARRLLLERIAAAQGVKTAETDALARLRRQKACRSRKATRKYAVPDPIPAPEIPTGQNQD
jgi:protein subunit release factor B